MESNKKITKIVISKDDELTDIVTAILDSQNERILLTFAEESDLLISPINLKVLLETADENEKLMVAQIIKNPTGLRNAGLAGLSTIDLPSFPVEEIWEKEEINRAKRLNPPKEKPVEKTQPEAEREEKPQTSEFQKKIDQAIQKSKESKQEKETTKEDVLISLDEDLPKESLIEEKLEEEIEIVEEPDLSKVDFSDKTEDPQKFKEEKRRKPKRIGPSPLKAFLNKIGDTFKRIPVPTKFKKLTPIIIIFTILLILLVGFIYINTAMLVKVKIYVEAKDVNVEKIFQGDENIKEIDFENLKIPVKTESVEKSGSKDVTATGTAFKGEKAQGQVNITYIKEGCDEDVPALELPAGHTLSTGGKTYTLDSDTSVKCTTLTVASITAIEVGEEYNLASGQLFTFQGYSSDQLLALNNSGAITGGSKEEYTVLSKADVDTAVDDLENIAKEEAENELRELSGNWEIIEDSITVETSDDSIKTDVAIGAEASTANVSVQVTATASYFLKEGFDEGVEEMLTQEAKDQNLFETDKDWELELDQDIEKEVSVVESNDAGIKIKLVASSSVKPQVDKDAIVEELKDMNWEEGQDYIKSLGFSDREPSIEFYPENFPESLKRFPKRRGGVLISVLDVS